MFAHRAYSRGLVASPDQLASLLHFAAAIPTIGFTHGATDLTPLNAAALGSASEQVENSSKLVSSSQEGGLLSQMTGDKQSTATSLRAMAVAAFAKSWRRE